MKKSSLNVLGLGSLAFSVLIGSGCAYKIPEVSPVKPQLTETSPTIETKVSSDGKVRFVDYGDYAIAEGSFTFDAFEPPKEKYGRI